jgi:hypothetical protein
LEPRILDREGKVIARSPAAVSADAVIAIGCPGQRR